MIDSKVIAYDEHAPSVTVQAGQRFTADLVVGADGESFRLPQTPDHYANLFVPGLKSIARRIVNGKEVAPQTSGFAAFRATVAAAKLRDDPELAWLLDTPGQHMWYVTASKTQRK
jgi:salicylate hydroxylase